MNDPQQMTASLRSSDCPPFHFGMGKIYIAANDTTVEVKGTTPINMGKLPHRRRM